MAMSRKHYQAVADVIHDTQNIELPVWLTDPKDVVAYMRGHFAGSMAELFLADNDRFDPDRFYIACGTVR